jgi:hypothetical protein
MALHTLMETAARLTAIAAAMPMAEHAALETACQMVETEARRVIGTYEYGWTQLAQSTQEQRSKAGFAANKPLLRTGEMRDSIQHQVVGHVGHVGSNNMKAVWQELGTSRGIPPRSFLMGAAMREEHRIHEVTGRYFFALLSAGLGGGGLPYVHWTGQATTRIGSAPPIDTAIGRITGRIPD